MVAVPTAFYGNIYAGSGYGWQYQSWPSHMVVRWALGACACPDPVPCLSQLAARARRPCAADLAPRAWVEADELDHTHRQLSALELAAMDA